MTTEVLHEPVRPGGGEMPPRWRRRLASVRLRIVGWHLLVLAAALGLSIVTVRAILLARLDERIDRELVQEVEELRALSSGVDPQTGEPFAGDVAALFELFLQRNVPARNEAMITYVDGQPFRRSVGRPLVRLDLRPDLSERWAGLDAVARGRVESEAGDVDYIAVPVRVEGASRGVFVVAYFRDAERREVDEVVVVATIVGLLALVLAAAITWNVGSRVLAPVRAVTSTAHRITETDLTERIEVSGADEVSMLARTFNHMLDRLEAAFSSQRAFVDDAGHELRTPITIIRGHLELLDTADPADRAATVALVLDELDRMHRMVEDLLVLAKAQRPDFLRLEVVDVAALTEEVAGKARGLGDRDWQVEARGLGRVVADRQRLTEALMELCDNAARHTGAADRIAIGSVVTDGEARLWVRDSGPGVASDDTERIFERFVRGHPAGRAGADGSGLGLAIVRAIAEAHHGRVELSGRPGVGATFTLVLPVDQPDAGPGEER